MTDPKLSAAAQTILDAVSDEYKNWVFLEYDDENPLAFEKGVGKMAAAAIRALTAHGELVEVCVSPGRLEIDEFIRCRDLFVIADELQDAQ